MSRQRSANTDPEMALRRVLHGRGLRYRLHARVPGRPRRTIDIGFPGPKVAVFVDGCFWHACPQHSTWPANNAQWWSAKLRGNVDRDRDTDEVLAAAGFVVIRVWEHELAEEAADRVVAAVRGGRVRPEVGGG